MEVGMGKVPRSGQFPEQQIDCQTPGVRHPKNQQILMFVLSNFSQLERMWNARFFICS